MKRHRVLRQEDYQCAAWGTIIGTAYAELYRRYCATGSYGVVITPGRPGGDSDSAQNICIKLTYERSAQMLSKPLLRLSLLILPVVREHGFDPGEDACTSRNPSCKATIGDKDMQFKTIH
jgi:hypothetical protein